MADAGILVELWQGGGGWLVCAGIAYFLIQRLSPSVIDYIQAKSALARRMSGALDRLDKVEQRLEDLADIMSELVTVLGVQLRRRNHHPKPKEGTDQK